MTDSTIQAIVIAVCTALPPTLVAYGALKQGKKNGDKADTAIANSETAAQKATEVHVETQAIKAQAHDIKAQTDGQLSAMREENKQLREKLDEQYTENKHIRDMLAELMSIMSAREGKPIVQAVRAEDKTGKGGNGGMSPHRRKDDPKDSE